MFAGGFHGTDNQVIDSNGNVVYGWDHGSALAAAIDRYPGCAHFKYDWKTKIYTFVKAGPGYQGTKHYLSPMQQKLATPAFQEASSESENFPGHMSSEFAREGIKSPVSSGQQIVSENEKEEPLIYLQNCGKIYNSFLYNFHYHKDGIKIHLRKLQDNSNSWDCNLNFTRENFSTKINIPNWDDFLFNYVDPPLKDNLVYERYVSQMYSISYDLKIIMEIKTCLVMFTQTSSYKFYELVDFDSSVKKYIMQICNVIFSDESDSFDSFDSLVDNIINSVPPSFWDEIIALKRFPTFSPDNIRSLTSAFITMFSTGYSDFGKHLTNSEILETLSPY